MPQGAAAGDVRDLFVLPRRRRHRRRRRPARGRARAARALARRSRRALRRRAAGAAARIWPRRSATFGMRHEDFLAVIDGMEMDVERTVGAGATDWATLDLYCDRVASAVGRLSVRVFGMDEADGVALAHHLGRALQLTNILRDLDEDAEIDRLYLPRRGVARMRASAATAARGGGRSSRASRRPASPSPPVAQRAFRGGAGDLRPHAARGRAHAAHHGRGLSLHPRPALCARLGGAARAAEARQAASSC